MAFGLNLNKFSVLVFRELLVFPLLPYHPELKSVSSDSIVDFCKSEDFVINPSAFCIDKMS